MALDPKPRLFVVDAPGLEPQLFDATGPATPAFKSHRDDAAIWLFSGGTTDPKAVVQTNRSYVNTTERYGQRILGLTAGDVTMSVPKLFFGYAMGSNVLFPFSVGASCVLFPERCTTETVFAQIERHQPTILINVPTMVQQMVAHPSAGAAMFDAFGWPHPPVKRCRRNVRALAGHVWSGVARWPRHRRDVAHLPLQSARGRGARHSRPRRGRVRDQAVR